MDNCDQERPQRAGVRRERLRHRGDDLSCGPLQHVLLVRSHERCERQGGANDGHREQELERGLRGPLNGHHGPVGHGDERTALQQELEVQIDFFETTIDEAAFAEAKTVADLIALIDQPAVDAGAVHPTPSTTPGTPGAPADRPAHRRVSDGGEDGPVVFPRWNRSWPARTIRRASLPSWILPLGRVFAWLTVRGLEHLETLEGPVVFASNHQSHMDTPVLLAALPGRWRSRVAVAMAKEFFTAHFHPEKHGRRAWLFNSTNYYLATLFFNAFPLPQREAGTRQTLRYIGTLLEEGYSVLIFPEGKRTERGEINPFRPGIGMIASRLGGADRSSADPGRGPGAAPVLEDGAAWARHGRPSGCRSC